MEATSSDAAIESALRALRHRDRTGRQLDRHLAECGFAEAERDAALAALARTGLLDDVRYAENRACTLARRGGGDALIRHDLAGAGVGPGEIEAALAALDPQLERAERIVGQRGASAKTARYLAGKGFAGDVIRDVIARAAGEALG